MTKLKVDMTFYLIQQIRLVHALTESKYQICIPTSQTPAFGLLNERFGLQLASDGNHAFDISRHLTISHVEPFTSVGQISRPLIFPHSITDYCRSLWADRRKYRYSFQGLITKIRKELLERWIHDKLNRRVSLSAGRLSKFKRKVFSRFGLDTTRRIRFGDLWLWESDRGREFPIKSWDDRYFRVLSNSNFVLCPSGDCIWSYRFFESTLCGAIPIVEKNCSVYRGFRFYSFNDAIADLKWSEEDAEHNYRVCLDKLTVPHATLNDEIAKLLTSTPEPSGGHC